MGGLARFIVLASNTKLTYCGQLIFLFQHVASRLCLALLVVSDDSVWTIYFFPEKIFVRIKAELQRKEWGFASLKYFPLI